MSEDDTDPIEQLQMDRHYLHKLAQKWRQKGYSAAQFEGFALNRHHLTVGRVGDTAFQHLLAFVWHY